MAEASPAPAVPPSAADSSSAEAAEALCRRCGRCCCRKLILGRTVYYTPFFCRYLGPPVASNGRTERRCTVYAERFQVHYRCRNLADGLALGLFPADCPYLAGREGYVPPVEDWLEHPLVFAAFRGELSPAAFAALAEALEVRPEELREELCGTPQPPGLSG